MILPGDIARCICGTHGVLDTSGPHGQGHDIDVFVRCADRRCIRGPIFSQGWEGTDAEVREKAVRAWNRLMAAHAKG